MIRALLALSLAWLTACSHPDRIDEDVTVAPEFTFYQEPGTPLRLFWQEWPQYADTRLTLENPSADCQRLTVYVNPGDDRPNRLSTVGTTVSPVTLPGGDEELAAWSKLPATGCAVLVTAGYLLEEAFMGLSFSTREGVFHREAVMLAREQRGGWRLHPISGITERLEEDYPKEWLDREVTVSFDFPDGSRKETTLSLGEAARLLDESLYRGSSFHIKKPWIFARFWVRAALTGLDLDFREQTARGKGGLTTNHLVSVDGVKGNWVFDPRDGRTADGALYYPMESARYLRFSMQ